MVVTFSCLLPHLERNIKTFPVKAIYYIQTISSDPSEELVSAHSSDQKICSHFSVTVVAK